MRKTSQFLIAAIGMSVFGCIGPFSEDFESQYPDVNTARADGAFYRGWLPEIVPDDSTDIREVHNIDSNVTWGCFVIPSGTEEVRRKLKRLGATQMEGPVGSGPRCLFKVHAWWPKSMTRTAVETYRFDEVGTHFTVIVGIDPQKKLRAFIQRFAQHDKAT
jgi:hypothetical protein